MFPLAMLAVTVLVAADSVSAQPGPILTWITNSSVKREQINGDVDWEAKAHGSNLLTASQTVTRFHILGNGLGYSFEDNGKLIFLFGDTISENASATNYHAADPLAWSTNTDGETPLLLNFFTNNIMANSPGTNNNGVFTDINAGLPSATDGQLSTDSDSDCRSRRTPPSRYTT